jgi:hypothetical protein
MLEPRSKRPVGRNFKPLPFYIGSNARSAFKIAGFGGTQR